MAKAQKPLKVQKIRVLGTSQEVFGITDGKRWFYYAYTTQAAAEKAMVGLEPQKYRDVNVTQDKPYKVSELTADQIQGGK